MIYAIISGTEAPNAGKCKPDAAQTTTTFGHLDNASLWNRL